MKMIFQIAGQAAIAELYKREEAKNVKAGADAVEAVCIWGVAQVKANASGAPGPMIRTGDYVRSIMHRIRVMKKLIAGWIYTNRPQARRLEFGFVGKDRLGRVFNQAPRPHWGPVAVQLEDRLRREVLSRLGRAG